MDADDVAARIREDVRRRREELLPVPPHLHALAETSFLEATADVYHVELSPSRGVLSAPVRLLKAGLRRLLAPVLGRQVEFNLSTARRAQYTDEQLQVLAERLADLRRQVAALADEVRALREPR